MWFPTRDELVNKEPQFWKIVEAKAIIRASCVISKTDYEDLVRSKDGAPFIIISNKGSFSYEIDKEWLNQYYEDEIIHELAEIRSMFILCCAKKNFYPVPVENIPEIFDVLRNLGYNIREKYGKYYCEV